MNPINGSLSAPMAAGIQDPQANQVAAFRDALQIQTTAAEQLVQNMGQLSQSEGGGLLNTYA